MLHCFLQNYYGTEWPDNIDNIYIYMREFDGLRSQSKYDLVSSNIFGFCCFLCIAVCFQWMPHDSKSENFVHLVMPPKEVKSVFGHKDGSPCYQDEVYGMNTCAFSASATFSGTTTGQLAPTVIYRDIKREECEVYYLPQNPVTSSCQMASGPPLDIMKKATDAVKIRMLNISNLEGANIRRRRWWLCLCDLKLYFFEVFGDAKPRLTVDIIDVATASMRDKGMPCKVSLTHAYRMWIIEFSSSNVADSFVFGINETKRCLQGGTQEVSMYTKFSEVVTGRNRQFGYSNLALY